MDTDIQYYGVVKRSAGSDDLQLCVEEIRRNGFAALTDVFSSEKMDLARSKIDQLYAQQAEAAGGAEALGRDQDIVRCPLAYDTLFLEVAVHQRILSVVRAILGEAFVLLQENAIINRADQPQYQIKWHRDLLYQHWTSTQPLALNFLVCVDDFSIEAGCTWVLPASHHVAEFPSDAYVRKFERPIELKRGSVIILDAMTYHRAGLNRVPGHARRALNHVVGLPFLSQQIDIPRLLAARNLDHSEDAFLSAYLGYRWNASPDVAAWRRAQQTKVR